MAVDDNRFMLSVLHAMLLDIGIKDVRLFESVSDAMAAMHEFEPDIVITDLRMGPPDGIEFVRMLRDPKHHLNPWVTVILLSGHADKEHVEAARDAGANLFLTKPVSIGALQQRINWLLDNPASFVENKEFFGPDRRRRRISPPSGSTDRRKR